MMIEIEEGLLEGGTDLSRTTGREFFTFYGIPYAEPPVGDLRFRPPVPARKWTGVRDGKTPLDWCVQDDMIKQQTIGSEDCLYVNVFTPELPNPSHALKPVMVHLCGGGYTYSNEDVVGSFDHLADYDVIMVTISYRLNIFGYLNLNIPSCAGNCGGKDIVLALKWIKNNIRKFGGDPDNVTLYGESAGGCTVNILSLSPMARGLFHKAIISAGNALVPWAYNDDQVEAGFRVGRALGFEGTDAEELVAFLRKQPAVALKDAARDEYKRFCQDKPYCVDLIFTPSREKFLEGAFLTDRPVNLVRTGYPVPTISGIAEKDGVVALFAMDSSEQLLRLQDNMDDAVRFNHMPCPESKIPDVVESAKEFYLRGARTMKDVESRLVDFFSDFMYLKFYDSFEYVMESKAPLYVFEFAYVGDLNESKLWPKNLPGYAGHGDENNYVSLCRGFFPAPKLNEDDVKMVKKMCTMYTNFARTGNPNPDPTDNVEWKPNTPTRPRYLRIDSKSTMVYGEIFERGRAFWKSVWKTYTQNNHIR